MYACFGRCVHLIVGVQTPCVFCWENAAHFDSSSRDSWPWLTCPVAVLQLIDCGSLLLALNFLKQVNNAYFRIGFNSLGAYGTINHLHFQVATPTCTTTLQRSHSTAPSRAAVHPGGCALYAPCMQCQH